jgi:hypothetical protein
MDEFCSVRSHDHAGWNYFTVAGSQGSRQETFVEAVT